MGERKDGGPAELCGRINRIIESHPFGEPKAAKRGRRPEWPYVPIIHHTHDTRAAHLGRTEQIRRTAYSTREKAVAHAAHVIEARKRHMKERLLDPRNRAFREQHGLPRELAARSDNGSAGT